MTGVQTMFRTVLIIDDSPPLRSQIRGILEQAGLFERYLEAGNGLEGFKAMLNDPADLVLCDVEMPHMDGFRFITMMQSRDELKDVPVILLTGREDREMKIRGLEHGAVDYVTKPFDAGELVARVKVQLKIKSLQDELKRSNEILKDLSNTDYLTKLYNRRFLREVLDREFQRALRKKEPLSLVMTDIDHFKQVNDRYGHQEGDQVISQVGRYIGAMVRRYDTAVRYGGEEFVVVLPDTPLDQAMQFAERIRLGVQQLSFAGSIKELTITLSFGVATFPLGAIDCPDSLVRQADEALYRAKERGRNRVEAMPAEAQDTIGA
jgi:diguanylate cyclase (GGDEF)-like protein